MRGMICRNHEQMIAPIASGLQFRNPPPVGLTRINGALYIQSIAGGISEFCLQPGDENGKSTARLLPANREKHRNHSEIPCAQLIH